MRRTARKLLLPESFSVEYDETQSLKVGPWDVTIRVMDDVDPDLSFLGKYTDKWEPGAIERHNRPRNTYQYFVPCNSEEHHFKWLRNLGYAKGPAREKAQKYVRNDYNQMERYGDTWCMVGVMVAVSLHGVELGSDSLWGIGSDSDASYFREVAEDCLVQALSEAKNNRRALCAANVEG